MLPELSLVLIIGNCSSEVSGKLLKCNLSNAVYLEVGIINITPMCWYNLSIHLFLMHLIKWYNYVTVPLFFLLRHVFAGQGTEEHDYGSPGQYKSWGSKDTPGVKRFT